MRDIRLAATRSENWATYDEQFRLKIEKNPNLSWGNIHGLENVVSGNGVVYRWVTLGPPPPHLIEGRPTPANRWGANWSIGLENVVSGNGVVYRWVTLGPPPPHLIEGRPTPANRWGANWSI
ncbi:Hypothetical predicted protein, partial [Mytilus galloprovincialis]